MSADLSRRASDRQVSGPEVFRQHPDSLPQREGQHRKRNPAHARFGSAQEILFVEGNSSDGTFEECERVRDAYKDSWNIKVLKQDGRGKGDAVRKGFAAATGDVLMILDADLTMPPEALPKYHAVIESGKAEFVNGTRLIYPMENEAMRPLNLIANRCFAYLFSYLVNTRLTDTLCGTKVLMRKDYEVLAGSAPISAISIRSATST